MDVKIFGSSRDSRSFQWPQSPLSLISYLLDMEVNRMTLSFLVHKLLKNVLVAIMMELSP